MNKRQNKKVNKKCTYPIIDETNFLFMNEKEREQAYEDYDKYCKKYCRFYHYRDRYKLKMSIYVPQPGKEFRDKMSDFMGDVFKRARKYTKPVLS